MGSGLTVRDIVDKLGCEVASGIGRLDNGISYGYSSDLLSDVMAGAGSGDVTGYCTDSPEHVAVGSLTGISAIIVAGGCSCSLKLWPKQTRSIPIHCEKPSFEVIGIPISYGYKG